MIELKNSELETTLLTLAAHDKDGKMVSGLLMENVSLGLKRKLQKIHTEAGKAYLELERHRAEVEALKDEEAKKKEMTELLAEVVKINAEKASMALIETIVTEKFYDFDLIEKFAE